MTKDQFKDAVCAHYGDFSAPFKDRVEAAIPIGISRVGSEYQWEFLDKYVTVTTATSTVDAAGKTRVKLPTDYRRSVVVYTDNHVIDYMNRVAWAQSQMGTASSEEPTYYTIIGKEMVLTAPSDGSTVYLIYTRNAGDFDLESIPEHLQYAVMAAVVAHLGPTLDPVLEHSYKASIREAAKIESRNKGRKLEFLPAPHIQMRWNHT